MRKTILLLIFLVLVMVLLVSPVWGSLTGKDGHEKYIYPVVRVSTNTGGGSGTVVYCKEIEPGKYSTYILTNHHVISDAISISEEWDSTLGKNKKVERLALVYVEIFKYRDVSVPVGTLRVEADIKIYNEAEDMGLIRLRYDDPVCNVAALPERNKTFLVLDESIAVGCSLSFPPLPTVGIITRLGVNIRSLPYHMSSAQIIYGNSGGAMFLPDGLLIGIPSLVPVVGWGTPITHMGLFIPIDRVYDWFEKEYYDFIFDRDKTESESLESREKEIEEKRKNARD